MALFSYNVNDKSKWKLSPITSLGIKFIDGVDSHYYQFDNLKKGSSFDFNEIREENDSGGFDVIAYELIVDIIPVELVQNYYDKFIWHSRTLQIETIGIGFGKPNTGQPAWSYHALNFVATDPTVLAISIEKISVTTNDNLLETGIRVKVTASVDLITDTDIIFNDLN